MWEITNCDCVQLKYDGIWCLAHVHGDLIDYYSRTANIKKTEENEHQIADGKYIGELMFGSEWAQDPARKNKFYLFDCIESCGRSLRSEPYTTRYTQLPHNKHPMWVVVENYPFHQAAELWQRKVRDGGFEGLVYRNSTALWNSTILREKIDFTLDLIITGFEEGKKALSGSLGSLLCARIDSEGLPIGGEIVIGGGLSNALRATCWASQPLFSGRIISVSCKRIFKSGKLRHAQFVCFHADKNEPLFVQTYGTIK